MKHTFPGHTMAMMILTALSIGVVTVAVVGNNIGCSDQQVHDFVTVPTSQPTTQPGATSQPVVTGESTQQKVIQGIDTTQGFISTATAVAKVFPGTTGTLATAILGALAAAFGAGRKLAANPPKTVQEGAKDVLDGVIEGAAVIGNVPGAGKVVGQVIAGAKIGEVVLTAAQTPPTLPPAQ